MTGEPMDERRALLLDAALQVFARFGFKKSSMDEIARLAGLSRQGLYLHFDSKEALFRATVGYVLERTRAVAQAALGDETRSPGARLLAAFEATHAHTIGKLSAEHMAELLEASALLVGEALAEAERAFADDLAKALAAAGAVETWADVGLSARDLAASLLATSQGLKQSTASHAEYLKRMRTALRIILRKKNL